ncbi:MAG: NfeD family protein [Roseobacter sp.]
MMSALLSIWWLWIAAAIVLGLIEIFAPSFIFLGFALGALATGVLVGLGAVPSAAILIAIFAGVSLLAWVGLRTAFKRQSTPAKIITRDVNDN